MGTISNGCLCSVLPSPRRSVEGISFFHGTHLRNLDSSSRKKSGIRCKISESGPVEEGCRKKRPVEDYNTVMKRMMRNPYEYHHDLGKIVGSFFFGS
ncbi:hypothetical protein GW17_00059981 [Ensete ventricosum]|nr:hypothetical protein GW17_00059981 [Ensete ventricosum]